MRLFSLIAAVGLVGGVVSSHGGEDYGYYGAGHRHHAPGYEGDGQRTVVITPAVDPVTEAIQWLDRAAASVHCQFEGLLKEAGAWPPRGVDRYLQISICDFQKRARDLRVATRRGGVQVWQVSLLASAARNVENNLSRVELPCEMDQTLQDALDIAVYLEDTFKQ